MEQPFHESSRLLDMEEVLTVLIPVTFFAMLALERVFPGRPLPKVKGWLLKGLAFFVISAAFNALLPAIIGPAVGPHAPLHLASLGTIPSAILAFLVGDLLNYVVHRTLHTVPFLWRWTHQMHHSAERVDMAGAVYFHPFDLVVQIAPTTAAAALLGISADAGAIAGFAGAVFGLFQHMNVRTPQWLGYVIQRPEAHAVHHARGVHAYNYGNFMLWDIVLGTFRNPTTFTEPAGFWDGASSKVGAMLLGRDIGEPPPAAPPAATTTGESDAIPAE
jgi:sterol desaturase/sphingolipid hydroxylase (fatty acid hydroxylase superfamily)